MMAAPNNTSVHHRLRSYILATVGVSLSGLSHVWWEPILGDTPPMRLMLVGVVTGVAWIGGLRPALYATALGLAVIVVANDVPRDVSTLMNRLVRFGTLAIFISVLFGRLQASHRRTIAKEEAFRRSERRYRRLIEMAGEGIWAFDQDGRTTYASSRMGEILGVESSGLLGRPLEEFLDQEGCLSHWQALAACHPGEWQEARFRSQTFGTKDVLLSVRPIEPDEVPGGANDPQGAPGGFVALVTDISPLKRAEAALREKESAIRSFYESSTMGMGVVEISDDDAVFVSANALTARFLALPYGHVEGTRASEIGGESGPLTLWLEHFRVCRDSGRPVRFEYQNSWPSEPMWVSATFSSLGPAGLRQTLCSFIVEDITERKRIEDDLRRAKESAESANHAKDRFLAVLSHELRTPLTPVLLATSTLLETLPDGPIRPTLEMMRRNIELEARLIDDLLDLSRITRGRLRLDLELVDVHQAVRRAVEICSEETFIAGLEVLLDLGARYHHAPADHARLIQIIWNLIRNAARYSPSGGRLKICSTNPMVPLGMDEVTTMHSLRVEFQDTGIGIEPADTVRIFSPFEQGADDSQGRRGGLGLGLAISRSLAEAMGGRLTVSSPGRGSGSTFVLELASTSDPVVVPPKWDPLKPSGSGPADSAGVRLRILLVEDNPDIVKYLSEVLSQRGHEVVTAERFATALEILNRRGHDLDLLLSDIELPDGSGLDLMREALDLGAMKGIAMSGYGMEEDIRLSHHAGFSEHLIKPIDLHRLESAIRNSAIDYGHADGARSPVPRATLRDLDEERDGIEYLGAH